MKYVLLFRSPGPQWSVRQFASLQELNKYMEDRLSRGVEYMILKVIHAGLVV